MKNQRVRLLLFSFSLRVIYSEIAAGNAFQLPRCRFHVTLEGFEWFLYNRTAAFDYIVSQMEAKTPVTERHQSLSTDGAAFQLRQLFTKSSASESAYCLFLSRWCHLIIVHPRLVDNVQTHVQNFFSTPKFLRTFVRWLRGQLPDLNFKDLLPFSFVGLNGGIVCGNMANSNILVAEFSRADGMFGAVPVRRK